MTFEVAWHLGAQRSRGIIRFELHAVLLQRVLVAGKPALKCVAKLASISENDTQDEIARDRFWSSARRRLGRMSRLRDRDLDLIEAALAQKIAKPTLPSPTVVRPSAHPIRGPHAPLRQLNRAR
jgi:hypothetical protein